MSEKFKPGSEEIADIKANRSPDNGPINGLRDALKAALEKEGVDIVDKQVKSSLNTKSKSKKNTQTNQAKRSSNQKSTGPDILTEDKLDIEPTVEQDLTKVIDEMTESLKGSAIGQNKSILKQESSDTKPPQKTTTEYSRDDIVRMKKYLIDQAGFSGKVFSGEVDESVIANEYNRVKPLIDSGMTVAGPGRPGVSKDTPVFNPTLSSPKRDMVENKSANVPDSIQVEEPTAVASPEPDKGQIIDTGLQPDVKPGVDKKTADKGSVRLIPAGPKEIKAAMKDKLREPEPEGWDAVASAEQELESTYKFRITRGGKTSQDSLARLELLKTAMSKIDPKALEGLAGKKVAISPRAKHRDGTIDIEADATEEALVSLLEKSSKTIQLKKGKTRSKTGLGYNSHTADDIENDRARRRAYIELEDPRKGGETLPSKNDPKELSIAQSAAALKRTIFNEDLKQPKIEYDENGQADLPGLHFESTLKRAGLLATEQTEQKENPQIDQSNTAEQGELVEQSDETLKSDLETARVKYVAAKRAKDEFTALSHLRNKIKLGGESKERVNQAIEQAQAEYDKARLEYVGASLELHLHEQSQLRKARFEAYATKANKARALWDKLGYSYYDSRKEQGKEIKSKLGGFLAKKFNVRTAISLTLLGTGVASSYYAGAAVTSGVLATRRLYGMTGTSVGSKDIFEQLRQAYLNKPLNSEQLSELDNLDDIQQQISFLEARAYLSGKTEEELLNNPNYNTLLAKQENLLEKRLAEQPNNQRRVLEENYQNSEQSFTKEQAAERRGRRATTAAGLATGALVGGVLASTKGASGVETSNGSTPQGPGLTDGITAPDHSVNPNAPTDGIELTEQGKGVKELLETKGQDVYIPAGSRGIEGALIDLKQQDPEKYNGMMAWIKNQYPGSQAKDSALIHRAMLKLAGENGYTIDSGKNDLSWINSGRIKLIPTADGQYELSIDKDSLDFKGVNSSGSELVDNARESNSIKNTNDVVLNNSQPNGSNQPIVDTLRSSRAPQEIGAAASEHSPSDIGPEQIESQKLDFNQLFPEGSKPDSISGVSSESLEQANQKLYEAALTTADKFPKTSDALKEILKDDYSAFMKDQIQLDARVVNRLQKFPVSQFMQEYAHSKELPPKQLVELRGLANNINELLVRSTDSQRTAIRSGTIRQLLIRLASERISK